MAVMASLKRIGLLTSGGDCAGLNAAVRAVVHRAETTYGWSVIGIRFGTAGLMTRPPQTLVLNSAAMDSRMLREAGTILGTVNSGDPFAFPMPDGKVIDRSPEVVEGYRLLQLDAVIGIGGDGSLGILQRLSRQGGWNFVGIPKTIDNDVAQTEVSIGFATAVDVATEALDRLQPTAASHNRVMVLEVMGRDAGHIALTSGIAGGADIILIPEIPYRLEPIKAKINAIRRTGRNFALVVVAEAVKTENGEPVTRTHASGKATYGGIGHYLGSRLSEETGAEVRVTVLGHVQRGAESVPQDRVMASAFGVHAVDLVAQGRFNRVVAWQNRAVVDVDLAEMISHSHTVEPDGTLMQTARGLGICLGDR
jgi:ATP-dependent phosphofructokinase / diphosphate-dependent phosphofructokinase